MTQNNSTPLEKFLVPVDGSDASRQAVLFSGCLAHDLSGRVKKITLLHVLAGSFLSQHMTNVDSRIDHIIKSAEFQKLKEKHIQDDVMPFLDEIESDLLSTEPGSEVEKKVVYGPPAQKIIQIAAEEGCSSIIMGRRGRSSVQEVLLGSVTSSVIHQPNHPSIYVVGHKVMKDKSCPIPRILVPVDGSPCAKAALEETSLLGKCYRDRIEKLILLRVIDVAKAEEYSASGIDPDAEANRIMDEAKDKISYSGIPEDKIEALIVYGRPVNTILEIAEKKDVNLIIMGKKGRSPIRELLLGSVSSEVLHRSINTTVAIVCAKSTD